MVSKRGHGGAEASAENSLPTLAAMLGAKKKTQGLEAMRMERSKRNPLYQVTGRLTVRAVIELGCSTVCVSRKLLNIFDRNSLAK
jgi:hypothetical protein